MSDCSLVSNDPFRCHTKWEIWHQLLALLPRGRAWQTQAGMSQDPNGDLTALQEYWAAYAEVLAYLNQRACALLNEMFCASATETLDQWGVEYGFPNSCEPFDTLCAKVTAEGGSTCSWLASLALRVGYVLECRDSYIGAAADCLVADCTPLVEQPSQPMIVIRIYTALSPAWAQQVPFAADALVVDCTPPCPVPPDAVVCLVERFKPAHVKAVYEVI